MKEYMEVDDVHVETRGLVKFEVRPAQSHVAAVLLCRDVTKPESATSS